MRALRNGLRHEAAREFRVVIARGVRLAGAALMACVVALTAVACGGGTEAREERVLRFHALTTSGDRVLLPELLSEFHAETGIRVRLVHSDISVTERLLQYRVLLGARSPAVDVYQIDVIWPALLASHLADLSGEITAEDREDFLPSALLNNTVSGRLVALPFYGDAGMLYYRRDLLEKHGFDEPPQTWDELEEMARAIQDAERAQGNDALWGYLWSGAPGEGLTCEALEWQAAHGGGKILNERGEATINNPAAAAAMQRAAGWIGTVSPPETLAMDLWTSRDRFAAGEGVFLRHWGIAWAMLEGEESAVRGNVGVVPLPEGSERSVATLGGWQLAVSRYSENHEDAVRFVRWMTSREMQKRRALEASYGPTRRSVLESEEFQTAGPWAVALAESLEHAVARPSRVAGPHYSELSLLYSRTVSRILAGEEDAATALATMAATLQLWGIAEARPEVAGLGE